MNHSHPSNANRDYGSVNTEKESMEEIRHRLHSLRQMVDDDSMGGTATIVDDDDDPAMKRTKNKNELDTGRMLSFTFGFILFLLLAVGFYAFKSLYKAILKRYGKSE